MNTGLAPGAELVAEGSEPLTNVSRNELVKATPSWRICTGALLEPLLVQKSEIQLVRKFDQGWWEFEWVPL